MAPHGEPIGGCFKRLSTIERSKSDLSFEMRREELENNNSSSTMPIISEIENAKCECCGMSEECTAEYIEGVREVFLGKWICGLCAEAAKEEIEKKGGKKEEGLNCHMNACARFNKFGRVYPALFQAEAMREMLRKRAKSISPKPINKGGIARSSSCIPAITRDLNFT